MSAGDGRRVRRETADSTSGATAPPQFGPAGRAGHSRSRTGRRPAIRVRPAGRSSLRVSTPRTWRPTSAANSPCSIAARRTTSPSTWSRPVNSSTTTRRPRWPRSGRPRSARAVSPWSGRPPASPATTAATGRRRPAEAAGRPPHGRQLRALPLIADCERGVGRPERPLNWHAVAERPNSPATTSTNCESWWQGPVDLGSWSRRCRSCRTRRPIRRVSETTPARLSTAYAEVLLALGRSDEALQWFLNAAAADKTVSPTPKSGSASCLT